MTHYFHTPGVPDERTEIDVRLVGRDVRLVTSRGVFSAGGLDRGTEILLAAVPPPASDGHLLDIGCGYGPIALTMALCSPRAQVWAVDVNERALELTRANAERLALGNVRACLPDEVPDDVRFGTIWSNPPIRVGKQALHALLLHWLPRLDDGGEAYLVVQKHLGSDSLQRWLTEQGWDATRHASRKTYRVLRVPS